MTDRLRLVVMGDSFVGKSSIIKRFLFGSFANKYTATVEDLFSRDYELEGTSLKVDILDTAGDAQFPAMRRLSISSAHAFLLVFSVTDPTSFAVVKQRFEEIREQRKDFQEIPIVIAGNKVDLVREFDREEVLDWVQSNLPRNRTEIVDCSASDNSNINEIFKAFLQLSKINFAPKCGFQDDASIGLRRNLSAYGRLRSPAKVRSPPVKSPPSSDSSEFPFPPSSSHQHVQKKESVESGPTSPNPFTPRTERKFLGLSLSPFGSPGSSAGGGGGGCFLAPDRPNQPDLPADWPAEQQQLQKQKNNNGEFVKGKSSKRSRSLIRRSSKKVKQQVNNVHNAEDCVVS